ncbi:3-keto-disaccharide hydrolase [Ferruginibacter sp. SUN106]|uniref:3-keto-disaccharide hydrolase n=1 Tax=Ferruginibacter sp. SUN106 TaxID=2978348 RepID=UPI003D36CA1F
MKNKFLLLLSTLLFSVLVSSGQEIDPKLTEVYAPVPPIVKPGKTNSDAPSDAIILFGGKNLDEWVSVNDSTKPALWTVKKNNVTVKKGTGNIQTKRKFTDYQLHIEWRIPENITGSGQARGNSGVFLASTGPGDEGYEIQVLDCYENTTYVNGQTGSIYKQSIPLANVCKKPGEWQSYDIVWTAPRFNEDGTVKNPGRITAIQNGVLVQNNTEVKGITVYRGKPYYKKHGAAPIKLQDHGDPSEPISYRNIWVRPL